MDNAQVEVTQEDREAAKPIVIRVMIDELSHEDLHQAFARHRIAAIATIGPSEYERGATEERAKIVAWLRESAAWHDKNDDGLSGFDGICDGQTEAADVFEAGGHLATAISNMEPVK